MLEQRDVDDGEGKHEARDEGEAHVASGDHGADCGAGSAGGRRAAGLGRCVNHGASVTRRSEGGRGPGISAVAVVSHRCRDPLWL